MWYANDITSDEHDLTAENNPKGNPSTKELVQTENSKAFRIL